MNTPLQLLVKAEGISGSSVKLHGLKGVKLTAVHEADSPNYLFLDIEVSKKAKPGKFTLTFTKGSDAFSVDYELFARQGGRPCKSFSTEDLVYLIVPDRFANGDPSNDSTDDTGDKCNRAWKNGRHGGDIQGIIDHLDYISGLGATAIWPTPLLEDNAPRISYHGYACSDYYRIDPRYGSNELYREFVTQAHAKGLKVIMDVVTNHCGTEHWWMADPPFKNWVHFGEPYINTNHTMSLAMDPNASKADRKVMEEGWFVPSMPDMNLDNPFVLKYFQQWAVWWVEYSGLDGFRVDTWFYNEKLPMSLWAKAVTDEYQWINIVGEVWNTNPDYVAYWQGGNPNSDGFDSHLPSIMDFPLQAAIGRALAFPLDAGRGDGGPGRGRRSPDIRAVYDALSHDFIYHDLDKMLIFLSNHDTPRIGDTFGADPRRMRLAFTLLATLRGIPQLFYGDELMLRTGNPGRDDGSLRMDFPGGWAGDELNFFTPEGRNAATGGAPVATGANEHSDFHAEAGALKADSTAESGAVEENADAEAARGAGLAEQVALYDYASKLFNWRKRTPVLHHGKTLHFIPQDNSYAYFRYDDTVAVLVFINNSESEAYIPWERLSEMTSSLSGGKDPLSGEAVEIGAPLAVKPLSAKLVEFSRKAEN